MKKVFHFFAFLSISSFCVAQVNLQTGSAEQSFPLFNYQDPKAGLSLPISLQYSSGNGLIVNSVASNVGTGWDIDAGGVIMRIQNGEPDDQVERNTGVNHLWIESHVGGSWNWAGWRNYPNGYLYNPYVGQGCNVGVNYHPTFKDPTVIKQFNKILSDTEQDKFVFKVAGRYAVFVIPKNRQGSNGMVNVIGESRIKVDFTETNQTAEGIRTTISKFTVITDDGIKYTFAEKSKTWLTRFIGPENPAQDGFSVNTFNAEWLNLDEHYFVINAWHLSEIENQNTGAKIAFQYSEDFFNFETSRSITHNLNLNKSTEETGHNNQIENGRNLYNYLNVGNNAIYSSWDNSYINSLNHATTTIYRNRNVSYQKKPYKIFFPDKSVITFNYFGIGNARKDVWAAFALESIEHKQKNQELIGGYDFKYGYFFKNSIRPFNGSFTSAEAPFARLCLLEFQKKTNEIDDAIEPGYKFEYHLGSTASVDDFVPARNYLAQDHWGYYNGDYSGLPLNENHHHLSELQYYYAVLPAFRKPKAGYAKNGLLKAVIFPTGGSLNYEYSQMVAENLGIPHNPENFTGGVSVSKTILKNGEDDAKNIINDYIYKKVNNQSSLWGDETPNHASLGYNIFDLGCFGGGNGSRNYGQEAPVTNNGPLWGQSLGTTTLNKLLPAATGVAITQIAASLGIAPYVAAAQMLYGIIKVAIACSRTYHNYSYAISNYNRTNANTLGRHYSDVTVKTFSPSQGYGKAVYQFTSLNDYPALVPNLGWPYPNFQRLASWVYDRPKSIKIYDEAGNMVKETETTYRNVLAEIDPTNNRNCNCVPNRKYAQKGSDWQDGVHSSFTDQLYAGTTPLFYTNYTGSTDVYATSESIYTDGQLVSQYGDLQGTDPNTLLQSVKVVVKSPNTWMVQHTFFPKNYNIPGSALEKLVQLNNIQVPVSTETWQIKFPTVAGQLVTESLLSSRVNEYKKFYFNGREEVKLFKTYELKNSNPIPKATIGYQNPSVLLRQPSMYKEVAEYVYDANGNMVETIANETISTTVNNSNGKYVIASVANAYASDVAYTSFADYDALDPNSYYVTQGNWTMHNAGLNQNSAWTGVTGLGSYYVSTSNTITKGNLNPAKAYIITYWKKDTDPEILINGSSNTEVLYQANNGWSLYQQKLTGANSILISAAAQNTALIDELRLYPEGALMSTISYREGVGKISECDANNRIMHYGYDALNRLKFIKDQSGNIIKTFEYNYKQ
jgi:hypothetical protein